MLSADSVPSREEWVKAIRKVIFKAQNMGDSVKVCHEYTLELLRQLKPSCFIRLPSRIPPY
jgi:hypothetical protein